MASGGKKTKIEDPANEDLKAESPEGEPTMEDQHTMFLPTDVTLKVEGKLFHLNKKRLSEKSPVFKAMFESDFEEKHAEVIPLPGKKFKEFEMFLSSFYFPNLIRPITEETVLDILPLADEYQVEYVNSTCAFRLLEMVIKAKKNHIDAKTFLRWLHYAEHYNLTSVLSIAPISGREYTILSLKNAGVDEQISAELKMKILEERCKLMDPFFEGFFENICSWNTLHPWNKEKLAAEKIENILVHAYDNIPMIKNNANAIESLTRIGEDFSLETLKKHVRKQASKPEFQQTNATKSDPSNLFGTSFIAPFFGTKAQPTIVRSISRSPCPFGKK
uniref:Uncharacterized protein LOC111116006 n=1 Tax=Crassostrea virginica TaxID=6565 RepID=A0A8B8C764_CRAVI|nr:uncharacterized protein LOC111116006 [Crassostrea virginica]